MSLVQGNRSNKTNVKWPGISKLNNFEFSSDGVRVWRAYQVGEGKFFPWSEFEGTFYPLYLPLSLTLPLPYCYSPPPPPPAKKRLCFNRLKIGVCLFLLQWALFDINYFMLQERNILSVQ